MSDATLTGPSARRAFQSRVWRWLKTPWTFTILALVAVAVFDTGQLVAVADFAVRAFLRTLPYILFAVLLLAFLRATGAERLVGAAFKGREYRMILLAALVGGLAPFCSCQVIPFIAGLLALGAPLSAVMAFWLASPLVDPGNTLITAAALGWDFAIAKAITAVGLGLAGGVVIAGLSRAGLFANVLKVQPKTSCCSKADPLDGRPQWRFWQEPERRTIFSDTFWEMALFLAQWLILAYVLEAILVFYVPAELVAGLVGGEGLMPITVSALVGMPAYLNSYVAPPMLAGLIEQGMSQGAAMAFIVAGAVSSIPAMAAVWSLVKPQVFAAYLGLGVGGAIISGVLFQLFVTSVG
ncbi:MAG: permease [Hyphomicrobiales bacterium]